VIHDTVNAIAYENQRLGISEISVWVQPIKWGVICVSEVARMLTVKSTCFFISRNEVLK
jgi:hypothetical protein